MEPISNTPTPPYYAVTFTSIQSEDTEGYHEMADRMISLASEQPGFLGVESARDQLGITVSYWKDMESIRAWKENAEHRIAQQKGKEQWYRSYRLRISKVLKEYGLTR